MTARPLRATQPKRTPGFRVIGGTKSKRPQVGPFAIFGIVVIASMFGLVVARTSLDAGAFQLADLNRQIAEEQDRQQLLELEVARLESPTRIAPLAGEMGLVFPDDRRTLFVDGIDDDGGNTERLVQSSDTAVAMEDQP
jgi:cell division protein FtsL